MGWPWRFLLLAIELRDYLKNEAGLKMQTISFTIRCHPERSVLQKPELDNKGQRSRRIPESAPDCRVTGILCCASAFVKPGVLERRSAQDDRWFWISIYRLDCEYNPGYTQVMKTAISIPDPIFEAAEVLARRLGISRSQLYTTAITQFLDSFNDEAVTQALNEVYSDSPESVDPILMQMQMQTIPAEEW